MTNSIYKKLADARAEFHQLKLKKTGWNPHGRFAFFELADFLVPAMQVLHNHGLVPIVSFREDYAVMLVKEFDGSGSIELLSPMIRGQYTKEVNDKDGNLNALFVEQGANLPGCHPIQNLGAVETYQRRYLWVALMEIVEHDALDASVGDDGQPKTTKKPTQKKASKPVKETAPENITSEAEAEAFVDGCIQFVRKHETLSGLVSFWNTNDSQIDILKKEYPEEFERLKTAFTIAKEKLQEES